jgi:hypothetical protein
MRRFVLLACAVSAALVCLVGVEATVQAQDSSRPPVTVLMKGNETLQKGQLGTHCWGKYCADLFWVFPIHVLPRTLPQAAPCISACSMPSSLRASGF